MITVPASTAVMTTMSVWRKTLGLLQPSLLAFITRVMIMEHPKGLTVPKGKARLLTSAQTPDETSASRGACVRFHHRWLLSFCCSCLLCEALWHESSQGGMSPKAAAWRAERRCYFGSAERAAIPGPGAGQGQLDTQRDFTVQPWSPNTSLSLIRARLRQTQPPSTHAQRLIRKARIRLLEAGRKKNTARMKTAFWFSWLTWERNKYAEKCRDPPDLRNQYPSLLQEHKHCFTIVGKKETLDRPNLHFLHFLLHSTQPFYLKQRFLLEGC